MGTQNGRYDEARHLVDEQFDALKSGMHRIVDRVMKQPDGTPSRLNLWSAKATEIVKEHPYLSVGVAFGLGYIVVKIARK